MDEDPRLNDRSMADFILNVLSPEWGLQWASREAQERSLRWAEEHAAKCTLCGGIAYNDDSSVPSAWFFDQAEYRHMAPTCQDCRAKRQGWAPPLPPI